MGYGTRENVKRLPTRFSGFLIMFGFAIGFVLSTAVLAAPASKSSPTVKVRNGTYTGVHSSTYNQDFFLGMPYAQQPVGNLRFTVPQSLNTSWEGARDAKAYSDICVGYGVSILLYLFCGAFSNAWHRPTLFGILNQKHA
jgi:hypothetical protein